MVLATRRGSGVRAGSRRSEPLRVWHYTATRNALDIERSCVMLAGIWGTDGPGVYVTDLEPQPDRGRISETLWEQWRPGSMEAFIGLPFIAGEMERSGRHRHVWVVKRTDLRITGLEGLEVGFWQGSDPSSTEDPGSWLRRPLRGCR